MITATDDQKKALRRVRGVTGELQDIARNTLVCGVVNREAYIQFGADLQVYNLWEALLYADTYEQSGNFAAGTTQKALNAVLKEMSKKTVET